MGEMLKFQAITVVCATVAFAMSLQVLARFIERRRDRPATRVDDQVNERLERIEQIVEATAIEVERIAEANRFTAKLLAERIGVQAPAGRPERVVTPH